MMDRLGDRRRHDCDPCVLHTQQHLRSAQGEVQHRMVGRRAHLPVQPQDGANAGNGIDDVGKASDIRQAFVDHFAS